MVRHVLGRARERLGEPIDAYRQAAARDAIERLAYELGTDSVEVRLYLAKALSRPATNSRRPAGSRILTLTTRRHADRPWVQLAIADSGAWVLVVDHETDRAQRSTDPLGGNDHGK
jgi:hypothetical protein